MSEHAEALAEIIFESEKAESPSGASTYGATLRDDPCCDIYLRQAQAVLNSDWYAARLAEAGRQALLHAANDRAMSGDWRRFGEWLRQRAGRLLAEEQTP